MAPAAQEPHRACTNGIFLSQQTLTPVSCTKAASPGILPSTALPQSSKADCQSSPELIPSIPAGIPEPSNSLHSPPLPYMWFFSLSFLHPI